MTLFSVLLAAAGVSIVIALLPDQTAILLSIAIVLGILLFTIGG